MSDEEELENLADEARGKEVAEALANLAQRYKALFGNDPSGHPPIAEIQEKIAGEMKRRDLRPYKLKQEIEI